MGRSKGTLKQKRTSRSKDFESYVKRHALSDSTRSVDSRTKTTISRSTASGLSQPLFFHLTTFNQIPYHCWSIYFFNEEYNENSSTLRKLDALIEFFERYELSTMISDDVQCPAFDNGNIDINLCLNDAILHEKLPSIVQDLNVNPLVTLKLFSAAFFEATMRQSLAHNNLGSVDKKFQVLRLNRINLNNYQPLHSLPRLTLSSYGKLISIRGLVMSVGLRKMTCESMVFACKCGSQIIVKYQNENSQNCIPKKCYVCGNARFQRVLGSPYQMTKISQTIYIKENRTQDRRVADDVELKSGINSSNMVRVELTNSLVGEYRPGDTLRIVGVPKIPLGAAVKSSTPGSCPLYIEAVSLSSEDNKLSQIRINEQAIAKVHSEVNVWNLLVNSLCPSLQGHEIIKAALILALFAGTFESNDQSHSQDYVHVLIIGSIGLGKSQLLRGCAEVASEGIYIRGNTPIILEPTITNVRENGTEDSRLTLGALASARVCCIDQLDKVSPIQQQIIYKTMVQQGRMHMINSEMKFSVASRPRIFATINPAKQKYDPSKTIEENIHGSSPLLAQFDMIFLMREQIPDAYGDSLMFDRVLDVRKQPKVLRERNNQTNASSSSHSAGANSNNNVSGIDRDCPLKEKLAMRPDQSISDMLPHEILRMYINYARLYVKPKVSAASKKIIQEFCLFRYETNKEVTFERLIRNLLILTKARAKIDLRTVTTEMDAFDAIEVFSHALDLRSKTVSSSNTNPSKLTTNKVKQFLDTLRNESGTLKKNIFTTNELIDIAGKENVTGSAFSSLLTKLNDQGYLLKVSSNSYKVIFHY